MGQQLEFSLDKSRLIMVTPRNGRGVSHATQSGVVRKQFEQQHQIARTETILISGWFLPLTVGKSYDYTYDLEQCC